VVRRAARLDQPGIAGAGIGRLVAFRIPMVYECRRYLKRSRRDEGETMRQRGLARATGLRLGLVGACLGLGLALGGCGGGSTGGGSSAGGANPAAAAAQASTLMTQAFGPNPKAVSGVINGTITITVKGIRRFSAPLSLTTTGPFTDAGGSLPDSDQQVSVDNYGAGMTTSGQKVYFDLGTAAYQVPARIVTMMQAAASTAHNGLMRAIGAFDIRPDLWVHQPRIVGDTTQGGVKVVHVTAGIDTARVFVDAARFTSFLTALQVTQVAGLPETIGPAARAALQRSVTAAHGDLYIGASDHVLREANMTLQMAMSPADRKLLGGIAGLTVTATMGVTQVDQPQTVTVLSQRLPYRDAYLLLKGAAYSNRTAAERGE
jgi:hypothetical protein